MTDLLVTFRRAGVLSASDVHTALTLVRLASVDDPDVALAAALAARAPRYGHVAVHLPSVATSLVGDLEDRRDDPLDLSPGRAAAEVVAALRWPDPATWRAALATSPLVGTVAADDDLPDPSRPLVLHGDLLYLQRYWAYERVVVEQLRQRAASVADPRPGAPTAGGGDAGGVAALLLTGDGADRQLAAVDAALHSRLTVLVGGPGTGKTTTVAAMLAVLLDGGGVGPGSGTLDVALAAPTGKAAARLGEAFREAAAQLPEHLGARLAGVEASTIHRLLGSRYGSRITFRHHRRHPLHHDVVIVDESSMISLPLMARLLDAVRPDARLVVVGDPGQLASVEAGSVLADIVGPHGDEHGDEHSVGDRGSDGPGDGQATACVGPLVDCIIELRHSRRFPPGSPLDRLASAINAGDADGALSVLADPAAPSAAAGALSWIPRPADDDATVGQLRDVLLGPVARIVELATAGDATGALAAVEQVRLLCAHRHGPYGVERWNRRIEQWLEAEGHPVRGWYPGRPVMVTANDYGLELFNGDLGVVLGTSPAQVAFPSGSGPRLLAPSRLDALETVHAMTIHKSQGSEFDHVVVVLPSADSRLATRELLYTAVTRARRMVTVVGEPEVVRAAIGRRVVRASGLRTALWSLAEPVGSA